LKRASHESQFIAATLLTGLAGL